MTIIDAHIHFFSLKFYRSYLERREESVGEKDIRTLFEKLGWEVPSEDPVEVARRWICEMDRNGVEKAVLLTSMPGDEESVAAACRAYPDRFVGATRIDPNRPDEAERVERAVDELGLRGIKGFPAMERFHPHDERLRPIYRVAARRRLPVIFHFGLLTSTIQKGLGLPTRCDQRFANPIELQPAAKDHPEIPFIIPHFGAGFLRETLMVALQCPNVYLDTSSSNAWMKVTEAPMDLRSLFGRVLDAVGPDRILFGTDSTHFPRGWRADVYREQMEALEALGVSTADREKIFGANAARLWKLGG